VSHPITTIHCIVLLSFFTSAGLKMMVAIESKTEIKDRAKLPEQARITIERRKVAGKQLRFNWDEKESSSTQPTLHTPSSTSPTAGRPNASGAATNKKTDSSPRTNPAAAPKVTAAPNVATNQATPALTSHSNRKPVPSHPKSRVGETTKLGVVMLRLLKRYGITDEEIIEGLSTSTAS
jgi:cytoskeletal protein RodZ